MRHDCAMDSDARSSSIIGSLVVAFDTAHVNVGPAPDLILVHVRAVGAKLRGLCLDCASLIDGYEDLTFRADGIVTYRGTYFLRVDRKYALLLTYSGMADIGEDAYEQMLDDVLPEAARIAASVHFFTSPLKHRWLNKIRCHATGERDFRGARASYEFFA
jgi:hypothetical protein